MAQINESPTVLVTQDRFVAFLDVLGFRQLLKHSPEKIQGYYHSLHTINKEVSSFIYAPGVTRQMLGDAIVLSIEVKDDSDELACLRSLLVSVARVQYNLAMADIWIRGAVCRGNMHTDHKEFLTGAALANAYELESRAALYPRVILDPKILSQGLRSNDNPNPIGTPGELIEAINKFTPSEIGWRSNILFDWNSPDLLNFGDKTKRTALLEKDVPLFVNYFSPFADTSNLYAQMMLVKVVQNLEKRVQSDIEHYKKYRWTVDFLISVLSTNSLPHQATIARLQEL